MSADHRYQPVRETLPDVMPPITMIEAERAAKRIYRHFRRAFIEARPPTSKRRFDPPKTRRCWASTTPTRQHFKGWGRLVHDVSHDIFERIYPERRPHDPLHAYYEAEIAKFVVRAGWIEDGSLKPKTKAKLTRDARRAAELARTEAAIKRWTTKAKRAATALKKLRKKQRRLERAIDNA